jgi:hypothetical protein
LSTGSREHLLFPLFAFLLCKEWVIVRVFLIQIALTICQCDDHIHI